MSNSNAGFEQRPSSCYLTVIIIFTTGDLEGRGAYFIFKKILAFIAFDSLSTLEMDLCSHML